MGINGKICNKCNETKDLSCFYKDLKLSNGVIASCKPCCSKRRKEYYEENKDRERSNRREYYEENKDRARKYGREYYEKNKDKLRENTRIWQDKNKDKLRENKRNWIDKNRDKVNESNQRRKALKKSLTVEQVDYTEIRKRDDACYLCSISFTDEERWNTSLTHIDHKIPLSRDGEHSYKNCALTHTQCNLSKRDKTPEEYWTHKELES